MRRIADPIGEGVKLPYRIIALSVGRRTGEIRVNLGFCGKAGGRGQKAGKTARPMVAVLERLERQLRQRVERQRPLGRRKNRATSML